MSDAATAKARHGFTLLEVLIAITILGIILTTVYGALSRTIRSKDHAEASARMNSVGREAVMRIADEIEASVLPERVPGAAFRGASAGSGQFLDQVLFAISSRPPFGPIGSGTGRAGRVLVHYYLGEQEGAPQTYLLVRSELPLPKANPDPHEEEPPEIRMLVCDNVAGLRLRYLDGDTGQWTDNWDSTADGDKEQVNSLPIAIEIALYLYDDNGTPQEFSTLVDLPLATRATPTPGK